METQTIRDEVTKRSPSAKKVWPNGLGFNWRGWEYSYSARGWTAFKRGQTGKDDDLLGVGRTPIEARRNAKGI